MSDPYDQDLFLAYVEGDLSPQDVGRFEAVMNKDERLRQLVAQLQADRQMLRTLPQVDVPSDLMSPVRERIERDMLLGDAPEPEGEPLRSPGTWGRWVAYSGVAALVAISATIVLSILASNLNIWRQDEGKFVAARTTPVDETEAGKKASTGEESQVVGGQLAMADGRAADRNENALRPDSLSRSVALSEQSDREPAGAARGTPSADDIDALVAKPAAEMPAVATEAMVAGAHLDAAPEIGAALALADHDESPRDVDAGLPAAKDNAGAKSGTLADAASDERQFDSLAKAPESAEGPAPGADGPVSLARGSRGDDSRGAEKLNTVAPTAQMQIVAKDPRQARQLLHTWASAHRVRVRPLFGQRNQAWLMRGRAAETSDPAAKRLDVVYVVRTNAGQARQLFAQMRRAENQTASFVPLEPIAPRYDIAPTTQPSTTGTRRTLKANTELKADVAALEPRGSSTGSPAYASRSLDLEDVAKPTPPGDALARTAPVAMGDSSAPRRLNTAPSTLPADPSAEVTLHVMIRQIKSVATDQGSPKSDGLRDP